MVLKKLSSKDSFFFNNLFTITAGAIAVCIIENTIVLW